MGYERRHRHLHQSQRANTTPYPFSTSERFEACLTNLLKLVCTWMLHRPHTLQRVVDEHHQAVYDSLDTLFMSRMAAKGAGSGEEVDCGGDGSASLEKWRVASIADFALYPLLLGLHSCREMATTLTKLLIYHLRQRHGMRMQHLHVSTRRGEVLEEGVLSGEEPPLVLSGPVAFLLGHLLAEEWRREIFVGLGWF